MSDVAGTLRTAVSPWVTGVSGGRSVALSVPLARPVAVGNTSQGAFIVGRLFLMPGALGNSANVTTRTATTERYMAGNTSRMTYAAVRNARTPFTSAAEHVIRVVSCMTPTDIGSKDPLPQVDVRPQL